MNRVSDLMTRSPRTCLPGESLHRAAQILWEQDLGSLPVVDASGRVVGMITDRDLCMAAYTNGRALQDVPVERAMARTVYAVRPEDDLASAAELMGRQQIRRLPVVDGDGRLAGVITLGDLVLAVGGPRRVRGRTTMVADVVRTLAGIYAPRRATEEAEPAPRKKTRARARSGAARTPAKRRSGAGKR